MHTYSITVSHTTLTRSLAALDSDGKMKSSAHFIIGFIALCFLASSCAKKQPKKLGLEFSPEGHSSTSCGPVLPSGMPVDCTQHGDHNAFCIYSDHCFCGQGFQCETARRPGSRECAGGVACVPVTQKYGAQEDNSAVENMTARH